MFPPRYAADRHCDEGQRVVGRDPEEEALREAAARGRRNEADGGPGGNEHPALPVPSGRPRQP